MIINFSIKHGETTDQKILPVEGDKITIFVGPNNSGKSLVLREVEEYFTNANQDFKLLEGIMLKTPSLEELSDYYNNYKINDPHLITDSNYVYLKKRTVNGKIEPVHIHKATMDQGLQGDQNYFQYFLQNYYGMFLLRLDGSTRFHLTSPQEGGDLSASPTNILMDLFINDESRLRIREIIADAFGKYFVIDPTSMLTLRIKLSDVPPVDKSEEQALDFRARKFHSEATDIKDLSDGIKAFTGIITSVFSGDSKILLIDEPEAFLHPPLARKLGLRLAQLAPERNATLIAATHSSDFIMGCIQSGKEINIIRLTYQDGASSAKLLSSSDLTNLMKDPLLRSSGVLSSLFHDTVIITESDADRAFYQEINERLISSGQKGINSCLFLNAQNKQTIHRILGPLRNLGIKAAAIVDIDVVKEGGQVWANLLRSANIPSTLIEPLNNLRHNVKQYFENTGSNMKRDGGIQLLEDDEKAACQNLFEQLKNYGIFIVPNGELESWMKNFGIPGHGPAWLMSMFERMGSDPEDTDYIRPFDGDVWAFIEKIANWSEL
ncbi:ATP-dependent endonuclease [Fictibacillus aquaticus]|uniref:ATP-dependent nuclease n=1 Tax=Fictibacillus aquaticus TaxID=2021314 RepID=UPI0013FE1145|nr:AAA family ATPase [Fictibacillus aquaticus]